MSHFQSLEAAREYFRKDTFAMNNDMALEELTEDGAVCSMAVTDAINSYQLPASSPCSAEKAS